MPKQPIKLSKSERELIVKIRQVSLGIALQVGSSARQDEFIEHICCTVATAIGDAWGERPGSWEADIGRRLLPEESGVL